MREIEIKILEINVEEIEKKLAELGAKKVEECLIHDKIFDFPDKGIRNKKEVFRIRNHENRNEITYKANPAKGDFLEHDEHETTIGDFDTACKIVEHLGLTVVYDLQKRRKSYVLDNVKIEIDKYPTIPAYLEIEGSKEDIQNALEKLGYTMEDTTNMRATQVLKHYNQDPSVQRFEKK